MTGKISRRERIAWALLVALALALLGLLVLLPPLTLKVKVLYLDF